jgi:hypothetical protein
MNIAEILRNPNLTREQRETLLRMQEMPESEVQELLYSGVPGSPPKAEPKLKDGDMQLCSKCQVWHSEIDHVC